MRWLHVFWCFCVVYRAFQVKGRIVSYFMGLRRRPLTVFGIFLSIVTSLILLTICISTILYCNSVKKSRINPESNYIKVIRRIKWELSDTDNVHFSFQPFKKGIYFFYHSTFCLEHIKRNNPLARTWWDFYLFYFSKFVFVWKKMYNLVHDFHQNTIFNNLKFIQNFL